jgi:glucose-1-phosphatase
VTPPPLSLVVDLGGVAARFRPDRRLSALTSATGLPPELIHQRLFVSGLDHDAELGQYDAQSIAAVIIERLEFRLSADTLVSAWAQAFDPNFELLDALSQIRRPLALFTNNGPMLDLCMSGPLANLAERFTTRVCSWQIAATKPDLRAFVAAADILEKDPSSLLLIDDSLANGVAARAACWSAIVHSSLERTISTLQEMLQPQ